MAGLDPAIHLSSVSQLKAWITGASPVMTTECVDRSAVLIAPLNR
jgi:hypothetical protein